MQQAFARVGWWWVVTISVPFALYSIPFLLGSFPLYRHLTLAALAGRHDIAGLHIAPHIFVWQFHSLMGLVFMTVAPFQFDASFRGRHMELHRKMGYAFVGASAVLGITGCSTMLLHSEFGILGRAFMGLAGSAHLVCLAMAIFSVKNKRIQAHRRWMIRTAVMGYSVINARMALIILQMVLGIPVFTAADYSIAVAWTSSVSLVEVYIRTFLNVNKQA